MEYMPVWYGTFIYHAGAPPQFGHQVTVSLNQVTKIIGLAAKIFRPNPNWFAFMKSPERDDLQDQGTNERGTPASDCGDCWPSGSRGRLCSMEFVNKWLSTLSCKHTLHYAVCSTFILFTIYWKLLIMQLKILCTKWGDISVFSK
jgi:hypothetical protein